MHGDQLITMEQVAQTLEYAALTLGVLLAVALVSGILAERLRLPRVTAYLLVGLLLGPYTVELLPKALLSIVPERFLAISTIPEFHIKLLHPMASLAMALVLFNMGCSFTLKHLRAHFRSIIRLSVGELGLTFLCVSVGLLLLRESWPAAILFAALAMATAPATTVLVFKENRSEGQVTRYANTLVAMNNVAAIVVFEVLFMLVLAVRRDSDIAIGESLASLSLGLVGSVAAGVVAGLLVTLGCVFLSRSRWLVVLVAVSTGLLGVCQPLELPYLLAFLVMGATVANLSDRARDIVAQLDHVTGLLCVVFFVIHGTEMDVRALLAAGWIGFGYIVFRAAGKYFGIFFSATRQEGESVKRWLGATLLCQAGAAIALSSIAAERYPELGVHLKNIILGTVVVFEIVGPIMIRISVIRAGEVPLNHAIHYSDTTLFSELSSLFQRLLEAIGIDLSRNRELEQRLVSDLMHTGVRGIPASATFRWVVDFIEHSHDNMLPVIDDDQSVVGMISYQDLQDEHFDPGLGALVRAEDLAITSFPVLHPDELAIQAWRCFRKNKVNCLAVVSRDPPHPLVGIVRRRDVMGFPAERDVDMDSSSDETD